VIIRVAEEGRRRLAVPERLIHVQFSLSRGKKFGESKKTLATPGKPLKSLKTAKEIFGIT
jgi:hypothetical protein